MSAAHFRARAGRWPAAALACLPLVAVAQQQPADAAAETPERPRVGLVLSGGGARGGAHIGVLRALEELRVPIDYIAGTSIGAIIGGLYASGMSVEELTVLVESLDWEAAFLNTTPRRLRSFRRKRDDDLFLVDQKPGLNDGEFELPIGLVQGQVIDLILSRNALPAAQVEDFDELAIPFRAVATDLVTGEPVVLGSGDLARAMRASMSLPAIISPVEIDGRLLVDGGVAMNLPVEVVHEMGADIVIAVDLTTELRARDQIRSIFDVTLQLTNLLTRETLGAQLALLDEGDVLLTAQFDEDLSLAAFSRMPEAIPQGYALAMGERQALSSLSLAPAAYAAERAARPDPRASPSPVVEFVRLDNDSTLADRVIEARLRGIEIGEPLDVDTVEAAINSVYGLELYQNVRYDVVTEDGRTGIEVDLQERAWGPNYLQLGLKYASAGDGNPLFGLAASYLRTAINELGGEWRATLILGDEPALLADLHQPFGPAARYFFAPALNFEARLANVRMDDRIVTEAELREVALELAVGRELASWGELRLGLRAADGDTRLRIGDPQFLPTGDYRRGEFFARLSADTLDNVAFPRRGVLARAEWRASRPGALPADAKFDQLSINGAYARSWGRHTMLATFRYDATVSGEAPVSSLFRMGGLFDLSGLNRNQLSGQHAVRLGASYYRRIGDLALFPAFAGLTMEVGNVWDDRSDIGSSGALVGGALWTGVQTPIGPVYVGWGSAEGGDHATYVFLGRIF